MFFFLVFFFFVKTPFFLDSGMKLHACQKNVRMKVIGPFMVEQKSIGSNAPTLTDQIVALLRINGRQRNAMKNIVKIL